MNLHVCYFKALTDEQLSEVSSIADSLLTYITDPINVTYTISTGEPIPHIDKEMILLTAANKSHSQYIGLFHYHNAMFPKNTLYMCEWIKAVADAWDKVFAFKGKSDVSVSRYAAACSIAPLLMILGRLEIEKAKDKWFVWT